MRPAASLAPRLAGAVLRQVAYWAPVWIPLGLFAQIALRGLEPSLMERDRLERAAGAVEARHQRIEAEFQRMSAEREAWDDPVWRERWRRSRD